MKITEMHMDEGMRVSAIHKTLQYDESKYRGERKLIMQKDRLAFEAETLSNACG